MVCGLAGVPCPTPIYHVLRPLSKRMSMEEVKSEYLSFYIFRYMRRKKKKKLRVRHAQLDSCVAQYQGFADTCNTQKNTYFILEVT
jgi:hypothetical protein